MTIFTIDNENAITAFATAEAAAAASTTPFDLFTDQKELAELIANWPAERLVATYNSLPGVKPVKALKDPKTAAAKIWERVEKLGQMVAPEPVAAKPEAAPAKPKAGKKTNGGAQAAKGAPVKGKAGKKSTAAKKSASAATKPAPKGKKAAKAESDGPRAGQQDGRGDRDAAAEKRGHHRRDHEAMGWQRHTVRGFVAGAMKKAGYTVESFKPEGGERSYRSPNSITPPRFLARPALPWRAFSASGRDSRLVAPHAPPWPTLPVAAVRRTWANCAHRWPLGTPCRSRNSADQSASARHSPCNVGMPSP